MGLAKLASAVHWSHSCHMQYLVVLAALLSASCAAEERPFHEFYVNDEFLPYVAVKAPEHPGEIGEGDSMCAAALPGQRLARFGIVHAQVKIPKQVRAFEKLHDAAIGLLVEEKDGIIAASDEQSSYNDTFYLFCERVPASERYRLPYQLYLVPEVPTGVKEQDSICNKFRTSYRLARVDENAKKAEAVVKAIQSQENLKEYALYAARKEEIEAYTPAAGNAVGHYLMCEKNLESKYSPFVLLERGAQPSSVQAEHDACHRAFIGYQLAFKDDIEAQKKIFADEHKLDSLHTYAGDQIVDVQKGDSGRHFILCQKGSAGKDGADPEQTKFEDGGPPQFVRVHEPRALDGAASDGRPDALLMKLPPSVPSRHPGAL